MRTIDSWLSEYGESHQHPVNVAIHKIAVPLIMLSFLGLAWSMSPYLSFALVAAAIVFYFRLSKTLSLGISILFALQIFVVLEIERRVAVPLWLVSLIIFVVAWVMQFIGHAVEGKRPSFLKDLVFLLIGPAWVMVPIYRSLKVKL